MRKNLLLFWIALWSTISCSSGFLVSHPSKASFVTYKQLHFMSSPADSGLGEPASKSPNFRNFFRSKKTSMNNTNQSGLDLDSNPTSKMNSSDLSESSEPDESSDSLDMTKPPSGGEEALFANEVLLADGDTTEDASRGITGQPAFVDQIYAKIKSIFEPNDNQLLVMEFPGRVLDETTYHFKDDKSIYSNTLKPQVVLEEEFRLTNDIFELALDDNGQISSDKGHIVGGPSGMKVSEEYKEALAKLVPKFEDFKSLFLDRMALRKWLLEEVEDEVDGMKFKGSRMELYNELNQRYENAATEWEDKRIKKLEDAKSSPDPSKALDLYAKYIARDGQQIEDQIAAKFNDLVIRGYYHEVRRMLGYMDVASPSELLEQAKSKMRQTAMLSMDESETIYPIEMQPVSWSKSMSTDFTPEDLLLSPDLINVELMQKLDRKEKLESEIQNLTNQPTGDIVEIRKKIQSAQTAQDNATKDMLDNFTEATFTAIKIAYQAYCAKEGKNPNEEKSLDGVTAALLNKQGKNKKSVSSGQVLTSEDIDKFKDFQKKNIQAQLSLDQANRELAFELESKAQAAVTQSKDATNLLQSQLDELNIDISIIKKIALATTSNSNNSTLPTNRAIANEWTDFKLTSEKGTSSSESNLSSSSSFSKTSVHVLFGSYGSSSDKEFSKFNSKYTASTTKIDVGMRLTKVTLDRGGWLAPDVLKASDGMYRTSESKFTDVFATYPVAFIIAKDVTIHYTFDASDLEQAARYAHEASESGGGFLCFSHSKGRSSTSNHGKAYTGSFDKTVVMRIPGPQILMWELERVPKDVSTIYPDSGALSDEVKKLLRQGSKIE